MRHGHPLAAGLAVPGRVGGVPRAHHRRATVCPPLSHRLTHTGQTEPGQDSPGLDAALPNASPVDQIGQLAMRESSCSHGHSGSRRDRPLRRCDRRRRHRRVHLGGRERRTGRQSPPSTAQNPPANETRSIIPNATPRAVHTLTSAQPTSARSRPPPSHERDGDGLRRRKPSEGKPRLRARSRGPRR